MTIFYRGFRLEPNPFARRGYLVKDGAFRWGPAEEDGTPWRFEPSVVECKAAIDEHIADELRVDLEASLEALKFENQQETL